MSSSISRRPWACASSEITIYDLACPIKQMTESPSDIVFVPYEQTYESGFEDMSRRLPDIARVHHLMGYRPTVDLPEMLARIIAHERQTAPRARRGARFVSALLPPQPQTRGV